MSNRRWFDFLRRGLLACLVLSTVASAQDPVVRPHPGAADSLAQAVQALSQQVRALDASVAELRSDAERTRAENRELRRKIEELGAGNSGQRVAMTEPASPAAGGITTNVILKAKDFVALSQSEGSSAESAGPQTYDQQEQKATRHAATTEEEYELLSGKVDDQYQTKVESASKYRMRISGIVLMNLFSNQGTVDNVDLPMLAYPRLPGESGGSFGATLRQSEIGFEVFGPRVAGARTKADLQLDLSGGFPAAPQRHQLGADAIAHGDHADGLGKHVTGGGAGWTFHFAGLADFIRHAGGARAFLCGEPVELGPADTCRTQSIA